MKKTVFLAMLAVTAQLHADETALKKAREKFDAADAVLNKVYKADIAALSHADAVKLRDDERNWITYRDSMSEGMAQHTDAVERDNPQSRKSVDYWTNMAAFTADRIEFLKAWTGKSVPRGITGTYSDSYGADVDLEETKEGIKFSLTAVRGSALHNGVIEGVIRRKGDKAYFKEKLDAGEKGPACELAFTFIGGHIVKIEEKAADPGAGAGVSYGGEYYKTGKLEKPAPSPTPEPASTPSPEPSPSATPATPAPSATPTATPTPATPATEKPTADQARKTFENTDNLLTAAYKEASAGLDAGRMAELRQRERDWIQYREMLAKSAPYFNSGTQTDSPKGTVDYWQTMDQISRARIDFLRAYSGKGLPPGLSGIYGDSLGGTLELEETKSGLAFCIKTVRGMARNTGRIAGVAQLIQASPRSSADKAVYKDHPAAEDDRTPCEITFTFVEGHIVKVEEKNGDFYHGFNAGFEGLYYRLGKLEKPVKID